MFNRLIRLAYFHEYDAQIVVCRRIIGHQLQCLTVMFDCLLYPACIIQGHAQVVFSLTIERIQLQGLTEMFDRILQSAFLFQFNTKTIMSRPRAWIYFQRRLEQPNGVMVQTALSPG